MGLVTITISTDNAAFGDDDDTEEGREEARGAEVSRILRLLAGEIKNGGNLDQPLYDSNGNRVGFCDWSEG